MAPHNEVLALRPVSGGLHGLEDVAIAGDAGPEDKENGFRLSVGGDRTNRTTVLDHMRALRELTLEVPQECMEHPFSDVESSSGSDFQSENLSEQLAERVFQNTNGRYDFEVFVDAEMQD